MGTAYEFVCKGCDYTATVCGGRGVGMEAVLRTMICSHCEELVDVLIGFFGRDGPSGDPEHDKNLDRCPECNGQELKRWPASRPCPRCGGKMSEGDEIICWD